jgi:RNA polymerase sigma factor (sigma-70 family)
MSSDQMENPELRRLARKAARRVLTMSADDLAEDVAQQAIVELWRRDQRGGVIENPEALVQTIARRRALRIRDEWEHDRRDLNGIAESPSSVVGQLAVRRPPVSGLSSQVVHQAEADRVAAAIAELGEPDRSIAQLTFLDGLKAPQVGDQLELAAKTVRNRLVGIRRHLAAVLTELE